MKIFFLTFLLLFRSILFSQALFDFFNPMVDNVGSFISNNYDISLVKKNHVSSFQTGNIIIYFDTAGRVEKHVTINNATTTEIYEYDLNGELISTVFSDSRIGQLSRSYQYKTYENGLLVKDSINPGFCKHFEYYADGNLKKEERHGANHLTTHVLWFGIDSSGRINHIVIRQYVGTNKPTGLLISNRRLIYNERGNLVKEQEEATLDDKNTKNLFCPNGGSAIYYYDSTGKLIEIIRTKGPSQKIKYLNNGLISEVESKGQTCEGKAYSWLWKYNYTYRENGKP